MRETERASSVAGTLAYMSPQQRQVYMGELDRYNTFKGDVFSLGMTIYAMTSLSLPQKPWQTFRLSEKAKKKVEALPYSQGLKELLLVMLSSSEESRPTIQMVLEVVTKSITQLGVVIPAVREQKSVLKNPIGTKKVIPQETSSWTIRLQNFRPFGGDILKKTLVYNYPTASRYGPTVVVKQIECLNEDEAQNAEREAQFTRDNPHPHILMCLGWEREPSPAGGYFVYNIYEPMPKSLFHEIKKRDETKELFTETELWGLYNQLLDVFSFLQNLQIPHGDIKPSHILLDPQGQVKVCDFDYFLLYEGVIMMETLAYTAPALRIVYLGEDVQVDHNVYKSGVFSLGMTLAHLSRLDLPDDMMELWELEKFISTQLNQLTQRYSERWVDLLRLMLRVDEDQRPDFLYLKEPPLYADDEYLPPIENEAYRKDPLILTAKCGLSHVRVSPQRVDEVPCMVSFIAKAQDPNVRTQCMDLMCVLDLSRSMSGSLIQLVKTSLTIFIEKLGGGDRVCIVGFNDTAERKCPLICCTREGKQRLQSIVQSLTCDGNTSIARGFLLGLEVLKQRLSINQLASLLLFSGSHSTRDGDPTVSCVSALRQCGLEKFSVSTFGCGSEVDFGLLELLAQRGKGQFHYINTEEDIAQGLAYLISNDTTLVARKLTVTLTVKEMEVPCEIIKVYAKEGGDEFELPEIRANETKELVFLLKPHFIDLPSATSLSVVRFDFSYLDNEGRTYGYVDLLKINFVKWERSPAGAEDSAVYRHWYRVRGADYLRKARELANAGFFRDADGVLYRGIEALNASGYTDYSLVRSVLHDMKAAKGLVQNNDTWQRGGDQHFASISYSHFSQLFEDMSRR